MKIEKLRLQTHKLEAQRLFFTKTLGFDLIADSSNQFTVQTGWSQLTFVETAVEHLYHYCFLIPSGSMDSALEWMEKRVKVIPIEDGKTYFFEDWNAQSFYFHDPAGNIAEFIERYDLKHEDEGEFDIKQVLGINEIGMPVDDIRSTNKKMQETMGSVFWKGDYNRFGTHGDLQGFLLLPNPKEKPNWFPTNEKIVKEPFQAELEVNQHHYLLLYKEGTFDLVELAKSDLR